MNSKSHSAKANHDFSNNGLTRNLNRMAMLMLLLFGLVGASLSYWSILNAPGMLKRDDNPRNVEDERALFRGGLYDRNGTALATTVRVGTSPSGKAIVKRQYQFIETANVVGYYSLIHGVGGAEAAFDAELRGNDTRDMMKLAADRLLHEPQVGSDIRLTIDATLQRMIANNLQGQQGAVVALDVPTGKILAMVSAPTFDPNVLDETFDGLQKVSTSPLLNRVTQGLYQPGGALETIILAGLLTDKTDMNTTIENAMVPIHTIGRDVTCAGSGTAVTLHDAYVQACPFPFSQAVLQHSDTIQNIIEKLGLLKSPALPNFGTVGGNQNFNLTLQTVPDILQQEGIGQGLLTVTPLQMGLAVAAIANRGNGITPTLIDAVRRPGTDWQPVIINSVQPAVITPEVADTISVAMRDAVLFGTAHAANQSGLVIHGHSSIAYTGASQAGWFLGYVTLKDGHSIAVAVVIENADPTKAAQIGGLTLSTAAEQITMSNNQSK